MRIAFIIVMTWIGLLKHTDVSAFQADTIRFAFLTDLHVAPFSESDSNLQKIVEEINLLKLDFVVVGGDLTNTGANDELLAVWNALKKLKHTLHIIPGNHETNWSESAGLKFNELWGADRFCFTTKKLNFIGFNTGPYMKMADGHVKNEDVLWIKNTMTHYPDSSKKWIVFAHYPLADGLDNWNEVTQILKKGGCKLAFCGHGHQLALYNFNGIPGIMGRAVMMSKQNSPGYQLIEIRNDSVLVSDKILKQTVSSPKFKFNYLSPDTLQSISISLPKDYSVNQLFPSVKPFFSYQDSASIFSGIAQSDSKTIIFGNSLGEVKAISIENQKLIWKKQFKGPIYSNPLIHKNKVIFGTTDGKVIALDTRTGNLIWEISMKRPILAEGIINNDHLFIGCGDTAFAKIEINSGRLVWKFTGIGGLIQGKPIIFDKFLVFGVWDNYLYCLNTETGNLIWKWSNGKPQKLYSPGNIVPAISNGKVFIVAPDRYMTALDLKNGTEIWRTKQFKVRESMGISSDGKTIYAKLMNDSIIAVSATANNFELKWAVNAEFGYEHSPCPIVTSNNTVICTTKSGLIIVLDEKQKQVKWKYKAGSSSANKIVIDKNQNLWISFFDGQVLGLKSDFN